MYSFPLDRLRAEVEWLARNRIEFVYMGDSNWGMLPQDREVADMLVEAKSRWGFPERVLANAPKNSSAKVFDLFDKLKTVGLQKSVTLSMQSWNPATLVSIKRSNIKSKTYEELQTLSKQREISTYSELILGLPGETLQSFCDGIDKCIDGGAHDGLLVYLCRVLPGSEMDADAYRELHGIETARLPIQANHGSLAAAAVGPPEYEETIVATKTMPHADWLEAQRIAWFVEVFFVLGIARLPLLWLRGQGVKVTEFARWAWREMSRLEGGGYGRPVYLQLHGEWRRLVGYLAAQSEGMSEVPNDGIRGLRLDAFGDIRWPIEEASWLALMLRKDEMYAELLALIEAFCDARGLNKYAVGVSVRENMARIKHWNDGVSPSDPAEFAKTVLWHGRRGGSMLRPEVKP